MSKSNKIKAEAHNPSEWEEVEGGYRYRPTGEFSRSIGGQRFGVLATDSGCGRAGEQGFDDPVGADDPITATAEGPSGAP